MSVSPDVHIFTTVELQRIKDAEYARGVRRGRFEAAALPNKGRLGPAKPDCPVCKGTGWEEVTPALTHGCTQCYPMLLDTPPESGQ